MEKQIENEKLFWSVFKNKFLNGIIFKRSEFKFSAYSYNEMNNVEWMIKNKHFSLLKEKIIRNDRNLNFFLKCPSRMEPIKCQQAIFKHYKNDTELFSNLFKYYKDDKYLSQLNLKDLENHSIDYDNVALFRVLINELGYCLDNNNNDNDDSNGDDVDNTMKIFYKSINSGSFEIATFLYNSNNYFKNQNKIWIDTIGYKSDPNYNEKVDFYYSIISKTIPKYSKGDVVNDFSNPVLFPISIHSCQLSFIIKCCKTISLLLLANEQSEQFKYSKNDIIEIEQLKQYEIPDLIFTKDELNFKIQSFTFKNTIVQRLYKMVLLFSDSSSHSNIAFYQIKYYGEINNKIYTHIFKPQSFGYYISGFKDYKTNLLNEYLFEFCRNDRNERIIPFFKEAIKEILDTSIDKSLKPTKNLLINYAIILNDLEILEMVYNKLFNIKGDDGDDDNNIILLDEVYYRKDVKIFDFYINKLSEQHRLHILDRIGENYTLSTHFKNNYPIYYKNALPHYNHPFQGQLYVSRFLAENYKDVPINNKNFKNKFDITKKFPFIIHRSLFIDFKLPPSKLTYLNENGTEIEYEIPPYTLHQNGFLSGIAHQLNWILKYRYKDIENGTLIITYDFILLTQYFRNNIEETILDDINSYFNQKHVSPKILNFLLEEIAKRGDIETIEFLINQFKNNQQFLNHIINHSKSISLTTPINQIGFYNYLSNKN
ncbi:hypothetical protein ACTFIW_009864 [Dictyostelium discoideum]